MTTTENSPKRFEVGQVIEKVGEYGGVTRYRVARITKDRSRVLLAEDWFDFDGEGKRPASWHDISIDENGNERAFDWYSKNWETTFYIYA